jgi:hypothetical protein
MQFKIEVGQSTVLVAGGNAGSFKQLLVSGGDAAVTARHAAGLARHGNLFPSCSLAKRACILGGLRLKLCFHDLSVMKIPPFSVMGPVFLLENPSCAQDLHRDCTAIGGDLNAHGGLPI